MRIIGLTGGIACGKSTVSNVLKDCGARIVDADAIAHELSQPNQPIFHAYVELFGPEIVTPEGTLDRAEIARRVFSDTVLRDKMNARVHPIIRAAAEDRLDAAHMDGTAVVVLDVPLLFEAGWDALTNDTWVVTLPPEEQLARLLARDHTMDEAEARARIAAQMPLAEKCMRADVVIENSGTREETKERVEKLWETYLGRA